MYTVCDVLENIEYLSMLSIVHNWKHGSASVNTSSKLVALAVVIVVALPNFMNIGAVGILAGLNNTVEHHKSMLIVAAVDTVNVCLHEVPPLLVDKARLGTMLFSGALVIHILGAFTSGITCVIWRIINDKLLLLHLMRCSSNKVSCPTLSY